MTRSAGIYMLSDELKKAHSMWSYDEKSIDQIPDDVLIEKTLVHLDMPEIKILFDIFPKSKIKKVWREQLVPRGDYFRTLNRFFAWYLFDIKKPDAYLKSMETRYFNSLLK